MLLSKRAPPHKVSGRLVKTVGNHGKAFQADGSPVFIDGDGVGDGFGSAAFIIEVNESADMPVFQQGIGGIVVHGGIQAHIPYGKRGHMFLQFMESDEEVDRVMPLGAGEPQ